METYCGIFTLVISSSVSLWREESGWEGQQQQKKPTKANDEPSTKRWRMGSELHAVWA